jgi:hypothetical protein
MNQKLFTISLILHLAVVSSVHATLVAYEGFDYPVAVDGLAGQAGGTGFINAWDNVANDGEIVAPVLNYTDGTGKMLVTSGNMAQMDGSAAGNSINFRTLDTSTYSSATVLYASFLGQKVASGLGTQLDSRAVNLAFFGAGENISVGHGTNFPAGGVGGSGQYNWGHFWGGNGGNGTGAGTVDTYSGVNAQTAVFAVLKIELNLNGGLDQFTLYLDPSLATESGNTPSATVISTQDRGATMDLIVSRLRPFGGNTNAANGAGILNLDEIRLGTEWSDVTPFVVPEPTTAALGGLAALGLMRRRRR